MNPLEIRSLIGLVSLYATRMLGLFMVLPVLSLYGADYSGSTTFLIGLALGIYGLTQSLFQIPLGLLSDRIGRKQVIIAGMLLFLVGSVVAALAESVYGLIAGRALQGAGAVASAVMALLSDLTTEQNRTKAMAAVGGSIGLSFALAMILGPVLAGAAGVDAIFWLTALLALVGVGAVLWYIPAPAASRRITAREALPVPKLFGQTLTNGELLRLDWGIFSLHMIQMASWVSVPVILKEVLGFGIQQHWWVYLLTMGGGFVAMLPFMLFAERRHQLKPMFLAAIGLLGVAELVLFARSELLGWFVAGLFLFFMAFNLLEASLPSLVSKVAPSGSRGTAMGIYSSSQFLGTFAGGLLGGWAAQHFGVQAVFGFSALAAVAWLVVAATMPVPRHWASLVVELEGDEPAVMDLNVAEAVAGIEDVVVLPDQKLAYFKVDKAVFDQAALEKVLGRPLPVRV